MRGLVGVCSSLLLGSLLVGCGAPEGEPLGEAISKQVVCPNGPTVEGIDVSEFQGDIDWGQVAGSGRGFAIARIDDGTYLDPKFDKNWPAMKQAGLIRGAYQFFEPADDPSALADIVLQKVGKLGPGDLPVTLDAEVTGGQSAATITANIHVWVDKVTAGTGKPPMIYTGKYFWNDNVGSADFANLPLWLAAYVKPCPDTPNAWPGWLFWQYNDNGQIPGISGNTDIDVFNGDENALKLFAGLGYGATYVSEQYPMTMEAGGVADVELVLQNTGAEAWDGATHLGTTAPRDRASAFAGPEWIGPNRPAGVSGAVKPGDSFKFAFKLHAPMQPGDYTEHWDLVQEGVAWFGDQLGPPDDQMWFHVTVTPKAPDPSTSASSSGAAVGASSTSTSSGLVGATASSSSGGAHVVGAGGSGADDETPMHGSCACDLPASRSRSDSGLVVLALAGVFVAAKRRRRA